jgi:hypothetical protein
MDKNIPAIVAYEPVTPHTTNWKYENIKLARNLKSHELLIRMVATGYVNLNTIDFGQSAFEKHANQYHS